MEEGKARKPLPILIVAIYVAPFICLALLLAVLNTTNPLQAGPLSILAVFILLYVFIFSVLCALLYVLHTVLRMIRPRQPSFRGGYYIASVVALAPVLLVALNTLGQLGLLEVVLILLLIGLGCFYMIRRTAK